MEKETVINFVASLDRCRCQSDIGVGTALHAMVCRVNGTPEATTPEFYGYRFHCVENIDPFEVTLFQSLFPPVVIRYDAIPALNERYHDLTRGLPHVTTNALDSNQWFIMRPESVFGKYELLKIRK